MDGFIAFSKRPPNERGTAHPTDFTLHFAKPVIAQNPPLRYLSRPLWCACETLSRCDPAGA